MGSVTDRICWRRVVGVHVGAERITATEMASTVRGPRVLNRYHAEVGQAGHGAALKELLVENFTPRQRRRMSVCLGIAAEQTFFATRPFHQQHLENPSLDDLLVASGAASVWESSQTVATYVKLDKLKATGGPVYCVAAVRRELAESLFSAINEAGVQDFRLEPSPWSLLHAADRQGHPSKRWKVSVRVLPQEGGGLAILAAQGQPLLWRRFSFSTAQAARRTVASAVRAILIHAATSLGIHKVNGIAVHTGGSGDMAKHLSHDLGMAAIAVKGDGATDNLRSHGLALSAKHQKAKRFDLFQSLRPPPSIRDIFPWKLAVFVLLMAGCMALMMYDKYAALAAKSAQCKQANAASTHKWAFGKSTGAIKKERKRLMANVGAVHQFLTTRVVWSNYLRDLPTRLPPNACLSNIWGACELKDMSAKKQKRRASKLLTLRGLTRFDDRAAAPKEIDVFLTELQNMELLQQDFPQVQLVEIKWRRDGKNDVALFTVVALPKKNK